MIGVYYKSRAADQRTLELVRSNYKSIKKPTTVDGDFNFPNINWTIFYSDAANKFGC
jgi:hypothetical protein